MNETNRQARLNGISAEPGTIIGIEQSSLRFIAVDSRHWAPFSTTYTHYVYLRYATAEESLREAFMHEPRSIVEHKGIRKIQTPFGLGRVFK